MAEDRHNAHVLLWLRWQHFHAERENRYLAMLHWATEYNREAAL